MRFTVIAQHVDKTRESKNSTNIDKWKQRKMYKMTKKEIFLLS